MYQVLHFLVSNTKMCFGHPTEQPPASSSSSTSAIVSEKDLPNHDLGYHGNRRWFVTDSVEFMQTKFSRTT
jgi:hypothetical protein